MLPNDAFRALADNVTATARKIVASGTEMTPVAFLVTPAGVEIVGLLWEDDECKRILYADLDANCRHRGVEQVILLNDTYYVDGPESGPRAREHPARREALVRTLFYPGGREMQMFPYHRAGGTVVWEEPSTPTADFEVPLFGYGM